MVGKLQNADHKSLLELQALGADKEQLLNTDKIYTSKSADTLEETLRKNNYAAVAEPTLTDDSSENYEVGSKWIFDEVTYICFDNSVGAAIWGTIGAGASFKVSTLGEDIPKGKAIYISVGDANGDTGRTEGSAYLLDITNAARMEYCGISAKSRLTGEDAVIITGGPVGDFVGLPKGQPAFASETSPGDWQIDPPTTQDYGIQQLGQGNDDGTELIVNGALSATLVIITEGVGSDLFVADQIGFIAAFAREEDPFGFISGKNKTIGISTADYSGDEYKDLYKHIWGLQGVQVETPATNKGFTVLAAAKGSGWETDWDAGINITIDLRDEFLRFSGDTRGAGNHQDDSIQGHEHTTYQMVYTGPGVTNSTHSEWKKSGTTPTVGIVTDGSNGTPRTAEETRSVNTTVNPFIRYKNDTKNLIHGEVGTVNKFDPIINYKNAAGGDFSELNFSGLVIGDWYELELSHTATSGSSGWYTLEATNGLNIIISDTIEVATGNQKTQSPSKKFQATAETVTFALGSQGGSYAMVGGDITYSQLQRSTEYDTKYIAMEAEEVKKIRSVRSSVEKVVGEWIDGSPLYEMTFELPSNVLVNDSTWFHFGFEITPRDAIKYNSNYFIVRSYGENANTARVIYEISTGYLGLYIGGAAGFYAGSSFVIQYTKN